MGFEPPLAADVERFASQHGYRVRRLVFDDPTEDAAAPVERYLDQRPPFAELHPTLFAHGVDSVGLAPSSAGAPSWAAPPASGGSPGSTGAPTRATSPASSATTTPSSASASASRCPNRWPGPMSRRSWNGRWPTAASSWPGPRLGWTGRTDAAMSHPALPAAFERRWTDAGGMRVHDVAPPTGRGRPWSWSPASASPTGPCSRSGSGSPLTWPSEPPTCPASAAATCPGVRWTCPSWPTSSPAGSRRPASAARPGRQLLRRPGHRRPGRPPSRPGGARPARPDHGRGSAIAAPPELALAARQRPGADRPASPAGRLPRRRPGPRAGHLPAGAPRPRRGQAAPGRRPALVVRGPDDIVSQDRAETVARLLPAGQLVVTPTDAMALRVVEAIQARLTIALRVAEDTPPDRQGARRVF